MQFADRVDAGRRLGVEIAGRVAADAVVLGLPRGGVVVGAEVARLLRAPLDVIVVRKLGVPGQPELAMGAIGEGGARVVNDDVVRRAGVTADQLADVEERERAELQRRVERFRRGQAAVPVEGRDVVIVDDGLATGSTAAAACQVARARGAGRIVLAAPVAPDGVPARMRVVAEDVVCLATPRHFAAIGQFYDDFTQVDDAVVVALLRPPPAP